MKGTGIAGGLRGAVSAAVLAIAGLAVGWLCLHDAAIRALPADAPILRRIAPDDPDRILSLASLDLIRRHGLLDAPTLDAVRRAALAEPLDARAFLILGHQQLLDGQPDRAVATLEAGQSLDPRQRVIHLLLLDRYLRTGRYADAAAQFSILSRLVGSTQGPIAQAMAAMSQTPDTGPAVRKTLRTDPQLERAVLTAMARTDTPPAAIFALASPHALADAANRESWGPALLTRLVGQGRYDSARSVWQRIYRLPPAQANATIFNPGFRSGVNAPPFDWTLAAGTPGAADLRNGSLSVDYYGRDNGELASQLLVLRPGRYRFSVTVDPGKTDTASRLFWSLTCPAPTRTVLMNLPVSATPRARRISADFVVPTDCPAPSLALRGEAGEFPATVTVTLRDVDIRPATGARS